ncbi:MAG: HAD family phosphatase [Chlamydiota bacterium]|nr:HAD family phosphatase [Chlamydiota bacterium]
MDFDHYKGILFDLDGVLVNTMPLHYAAWKQTAADVGVILSREEIYKREGEKGDKTAKDILALASLDASQTNVRQLLEKKEALYKAGLPVGPVEGAEELLSLLKTQGKHLGLVTGSSSRDVDALLSPDFLRYFDVVVTSDQILQGKPDPQSYLLAKTLLKLEAEDILVIENAPYGIRAAKGAGLYCIALRTSLPDHYLSEVDRVVDGLTDVRGLLLDKSFLCPGKTQHADQDANAVK